MIDIVLNKLDSNSVVNYGTSYYHGFKYYLKGDIITRVYKGGFLKSEIIIDTCNTYITVLAKKINYER